jgi:hypothetical protein
MFFVTGLKKFIVAALSISFLSSVSAQTVPFRAATKEDIIGSWYRVSGSNLKTNKIDNKKYRRIFFQEDGTTKEWMGYGNEPQSADQKFPGLLDLPINVAHYTIKNGDIYIEKGQSKTLLGGMFFAKDLTDPKYIEKFRIIGTPKKGDLLLISPVTGEADLMRKIKSDR